AATEIGPVVAPKSEVECLGHSEVLVNRETYVRLLGGQITDLSSQIAAKGGKARSRNLGEKRFGQCAEARRRDYIASEGLPGSRCGTADGNCGAAEVGWDIDLVSDSAIGSWG